MNFEVYCDECHPDLLTSQSPGVPYMVIGSLWLRADQRQFLKDEIHRLRDTHKVGGEIKWRKVSPSRIGFYKDLMALFAGQGDELRFRCIAVKWESVDLQLYHNAD